MNFKNIVFVALALYVFVDISVMLLKHYGLTTRDETCRNQVIEKYYEKHGSLEHFSKRSAMSNYVLMHGTLEGFPFKNQSER